MFPLALNCLMNSRVTPRVSTRKRKEEQKKKKNNMLCERERERCIKTKTIPKTIGNKYRLQISFSIQVWQRSNQKYKKKKRIANMNILKIRNVIIHCAAS